MVKPYPWICVLLLRLGHDVTLVTWGAMVKETLAAAEHLAKEGIEAEVIDVATHLSPWIWKLF